MGGKGCKAGSTIGCRGQGDSAACQGQGAVLCYFRVLGQQERYTRACMRPKLASLLRTPCWPSTTTVQLLMDVYMCVHSAGSLLFLLPTLPNGLSVSLRCSQTCSSCCSSTRHSHMWAAACRCVCMGVRAVVCCGVLWCGVLGRAVVWCGVWCLVCGVPWCYESMFGSLCFVRCKQCCAV